MAEHTHWDEHGGDRYRRENCPGCRDEAKPDLIAAAAIIPIVIVPASVPGSYRTGSLPASLTPADIERVLGFPPNVDDDAEKVEHSWAFTVDGHPCGIWDYKGARWSVFDPDGALPSLFAES